MGCQLTSAEIMANFARAKTNIIKSAKDADRPPSAVRLMVVTKKFPEHIILPLLKADHKLFGENKVQELIAKWPPLLDRFPDARVHFIGHLQTNKAVDVVKICSAIHSVDREKLVRAIVKAIDKVGVADNPLKQPEIYIQVNIGNEPQKSGVAVADVEDFVKLCIVKYQLKVTGLMAIPPANEPAAPYFAVMRELAVKCQLTGLSMGMSGDYREAIMAGATIVRLGSVIMGNRYN